MLQVLSVPLNEPSKQSLCRASTAGFNREHSHRSSNRRIAGDQGQITRPEAMENGRPATDLSPWASPNLKSSKESNRPTAIRGTSNRCVADDQRPRCDPRAALKPRRCTSARRPASAIPLGYAKCDTCLPVQVWSSAREIEIDCSASAAESMVRISWPWVWAPMSTSGHRASSLKIGRAHV